MWNLEDDNTWDYSGYSANEIVERMVFSDTRIVTNSSLWGRRGSLEDELLWYQRGNSLNADGTPIYIEPPLNYYTKDLFKNVVLYDKENYTNHNILCGKNVHNRNYKTVLPVTLEPTTKEDLSTKMGALDTSKAGGNPESAADNVSHEFECSVCLCPEVDVYTCVECNTHICKDCLKHNVNTAIDHSLGENKYAEVACINNHIIHDRIIIGAIDDKTWASYTKMIDVLKSREMVDTLKKLHIHELESAIEKEKIKWNLMKCGDSNSSEIATLALQHIQNDLCHSACPRCDAAFYGFDNCFVLECPTEKHKDENGKLMKKCHFCAFCETFYGTKYAVEEHIRKCPSFLPCWENKFRASSNDPILYEMSRNRNVHGKIAQYLAEFTDQVI